VKHLWQVSKLRELARREVISWIGQGFGSRPTCGFSLRKRLFARCGWTITPSNSLRATNAVSGCLGRRWQLLFGAVGGNT